MYVLVGTYIPLLPLPSPLSPLLPLPSPPLSPPPPSSQSQKLYLCKVRLCMLTGYTSITCSLHQQAFYQQANNTHIQ